MHDSDTHLPDEYLISLADGELDARRATAARAHLASCWECRTRAAQIERTIARVVEATHEDLNARRPPGDGSRAMLMARLAQARQEEGAVGSSRWRRAPLGAMAAAAATVVVGLTLLAGWLAMRPATISRDEQSRHNPDVDLTPGAAVFRSSEVICRDRPRVGPPEVSRDVALAVFRQYGISDPTPNAYELDYLVSPEIGGSTDVRNLWPQPYAGRWNAHLKDALEDRLYDLVCSGEIDLLTAQRDVATDWVAAYKKYFRTDAPIEAHRSFRKDTPWR